MTSMNSGTISYRGRSDVQAQTFAGKLAREFSLWTSIEQQSSFKLRALFLVYLPILLFTKK